MEYDVDKDEEEVDEEKEPEEPQKSDEHGDRKKKKTIGYHCKQLFVSF